MSWNTSDPVIIWGCVCELVVLFAIDSNHKPKKMMTKPILKMRKNKQATTESRRHLSAVESHCHPRSTVTAAESRRLRSTVAAVESRRHCSTVAAAPPSNILVTFEYRRHSSPSLHPCLISFWFDGCLYDNHQNKRKTNNTIQSNPYRTPNQRKATV